jgi:hypothetical protein
MDDEDIPTDRDWLRQQVKELFKLAQQGQTIDHAVCVKYADLLFKMMPPEPRGQEPVSERMRRLLAKG